MAYIDGIIKTELIEEKGALAVYRRKFKLLSLGSFIIGICGIVAYVVLSMLVHTSGSGSFEWPDIFLIFAVPLAIGLVFLISFIRLEHIEKKQQASSECEFYSDCFVCRRKTVSGITEHRHGYIDAQFKGEKGNYAYIFSTGKGEFTLFSLVNLTDSEKAVVFALLNHTPIPDGMPELKKYTDTKE